MPNNHLDFGVDLLPVTTDTYNLGISDKKWNNIYTNTFIGSLYNAKAMPDGKSTKPYHLIAEFSLTTNSTQINTKIVFLVSNYYSTEASGILEVSCRWEGNATSPAWIRNHWLVCRGVDPNNFIVTWEYHNDKMVNLRIYAKLTGWYSFNFTRLQEHNWGSPEQKWILHQVNNASEYALAAIPAAETLTTSSILEIKNNSATTSAAKLTTTTNAVAYYTNTTGTFGTKASANGALYATATNGALAWGTLPIAQGGTGATSAENARSNLGLGSIAVKADTAYVKYAGNITSVGSGSPHANVKTWWENTSNVPKLSMVAAYNNSGTEWSFLFSKGNADKTYGSVIRWGYNDKYMYILRKKAADTWLSSDWEKMSAGYADSAGSIAWSGITSTPTTLSGYGITDGNKLSITKNNAATFYLMGTTTTVSDTASDITAVASTAMTYNGADKGTARITLGTATATSSTGGHFGELFLYSTGTNGTSIKSAANSTAAYVATLLAATGTIAYTTDITTAIQALDVTEKTNTASQTIDKISETDGKISVTFKDISITKSQVSDFPTTMTPASHSHGNITNTGTIGTAGKKKLVIVGTDNKVTTGAEIGSTTTTFLNNSGAWTTPANNAVTHTLGNTTKFYVTGTTSATGTTAGDTFDDGVYVTTTAGQLNAVSYLIGTHVMLSYNTTDQSLDFSFV